MVAVALALAACSGTSGPVTGDAGQDGAAGDSSTSDDAGVCDVDCSAADGSNDGSNDGSSGDDAENLRDGGSCPGDTTQPCPTAGLVCTFPMRGGCTCEATDSGSLAWKCFYPP